MANSDDSLGNFTRRRWMLAAGALAAAAPTRPVRAAVQRERVFIGLTPVFLDDQVSFLERWRDWFEKRLERPVSFVQRGNYREIVDLVRQGKLDFAWLCGYPYVRYRRELRLVAAPLWRGRPFYQAYVIVPGDDRDSRSLFDLRGKVFAYSDPDSNSGYLYPQYLLVQAGENPGGFFSRSFYTWGHRKVVEAVSVGLAAGGAVDGYIWEVLNDNGSDLTRGTRVIARSPLLGHPPFVARGDIPQAEFDRFRRALMGMASDSEGATLLGSLRLDGFTDAQPALYDGIARMVSRVSRS
jgi:phosphonate transport system substrate-binding protein